jgi:hypothetical protein
MKPNHDNGPLPTSERPFRVLVIAGSDRRQYNRAGVASKARALMLRMADRLPQEREIDDEDLGNADGRQKSQSRNACVSTAMALCWLCNCYEAGHKGRAESVAHRTRRPRLTSPSPLPPLAPYSLSSVRSGASGFFIPTTW